MEVICDNDKKPLIIIEEIAVSLVVSGIKIWPYDDLYDVQIENEKALKQYNSKFQFFLVGSRQRFFDIS